MDGLQRLRSQSNSRIAAKSGSFVRRLSFAQTEWYQQFMSRPYEPAGPNHEEMSIRELLVAVWNERLRCCLLSRRQLLFSGTVAEEIKFDMFWLRDSIYRLISRTGFVSEDVDEAMQTFLFGKAPVSLSLSQHLSRKRSYQENLSILKGDIESRYENLMLQAILRRIVAPSPEEVESGEMKALRQAFEGMHLSAHDANLDPAARR